MDESIRERKALLESRLSDAYREVDHLIITVSSAVLAFSVAFIRPNGNAMCSVIIIMSWISLIIAIAAVLTSLQLEVSDKRNRILQLRNGAWDKGGLIDAAIGITNGAAKIAFGLGLLFLTVYLVTNIA